jgi:hypothetical protein
MDWAKDFNYDADRRDCKHREDNDGKPGIESVKSVAVSKERFL